MPTYYVMTRHRSHFGSDSTSMTLSRNNKFSRDRSKSWTWRVKEQQPTADSAAAAAADALPGSEPGARLPVTAPPGARVVVSETALDNDQQEPPPPPPGKPATPRAQEFLPPMAGEEVEGTERALSPAGPVWSQDSGPIPSKGTDADVQLGPIPDKGTDPDAEQATERCRATYEPVSVGVLQCNLCGKMVKGDRWALRAHQLTSSRCMYHQGHASKAREPCVHCGTPLAAGDAWARHQHARHCRRQGGRSPPHRATSQTRRAAGSRRRSNSPPLQRWTAAQWREWTSARTEHWQAPQTSPQVELARESVANRLAEASQSGELLASLKECAAPVIAGAASESSHQPEKEAIDEAQEWWNSCRVQHWASESAQGETLLPTEGSKAKTGGGWDRRNKLPQPPPEPASLEQEEPPSYPSNNEDRWHGREWVWAEGHTSPSYPCNEDRWQGWEWEEGHTPWYPRNEDRWQGREHTTPPYPYEDRWHSREWDGDNSWWSQSGWQTWR